MLLFEKYADDFINNTVSFGQRIQKELNNTNIKIILKIQEYINHLHLHDAIGKKNHLPLGSGEIDYFSILSELGSNLKTIVFETKTVVGLKASVEYFRENMS